VTKTNSPVVFETLQTEREKEQPQTAERLPPCEKRAKLQVDVDLVISTEASETETENYTDVFVDKKETYSDVEPSSPEQGVGKADSSSVSMEPMMVPEILTGFTEAIMIEDEDEPGLVMDVSSAIEAARPDREC